MVLDTKQVKEIYDLANAIVSAGGEITSLVSRDSDEETSERAERVVLQGDVNSALGDLFFDSCEYVAEANGKATAPGLVGALGSKGKTYWTFFVTGFKLWKGTAGLKKAGKCVTGLLGTATDAVELAVWVPSGPVVVLKGISLAFEATSTLMDCSDALTEGTAAFAQLTAKQVRAFGNISDRLASQASTFIVGKMDQAIDYLNPDQYDLNSLPQGARAELFSAIYSLRLAVAASSFKSLLTNISDQEARSYANAVVLANSQEANEGAMSAINSSSRDQLLKEFSGLNIAAAWGRFMEKVPLGRKSQGSAG